MKKILYTIIISVFIVAWADIASAQLLSAKNQEIVEAYNQLKKHPNSKEDQLNYIKIFPANKAEFLQIFDPKDFSQLYNNSYQYIDAFVKLDKYYPSAVIIKSINIGKNMVWEADATGQIQHEIVGMGNSYTSIFVRDIKLLNSKERANLITFLADVENHRAYPEYKRLIESLTEAGEKNWQVSSPMLCSNAKSSRMIKTIYPTNYQLIAEKVIIFNDTNLLLYPIYHHLV